MHENSVNNSHSLLFHYKKGKNSFLSAEKVCEVYGYGGAITKEHQRSGEIFLYRKILLSKMHPALFDKSQKKKKN